MKILVRDILITLAIAAVIYFALHAAVQDYIIWESSMEPNFYQGQLVMVNKIAYKFGEPQRGDVIILHPPSGTEQDGIPFIKRVIGLPGETIEVKNGAVYINGLKLDETYILEPITYTVASKKIPENQYFVLGDNRNISNDSHRGWTVPRQNIIGRAWLTIWPPERWGLATIRPSLVQTTSLAYSW